MMNLKIENKYLNITNYPSVERYLESMANKGWLINKIIVGSLFIFKKIKPQELDFSISPYERETAFTKKSKEEGAEFESACESIGWNYCTKSYNLHIYYKEKDSDALDIHTDEEEEFKLLENMAKTQMMGYYVLIPYLIFTTWMISGGMATSVFFMQNGLNQTIVPLLPMQIILAIIHLVHTKKFLKTNKNNIELGRKIEYSEGKFYFTRINFALAFIVIILFVLYVCYSAIFLENKILLFAFLPVSIGLVVGQIYRMFVKPSKHSKRYKTSTFIIAISAAVIISIGISIIGMQNMSELTGGKNPSNREKYRILLRSDFIETSEETGDGTLLQSVSILLPRSYEYRSSGSHKDEISYIETQYAKALTKSIAQELVKRYKGEAVKNLRKWYYPYLEYSYESGDLQESLIDRGLTRADFDRLKEKDLKQAINESIDIMKEQATAKANPKLWDVDEACFLAYNKEEIVLRKGKEVFVLKGNDFMDVEVIEISKGKLGLN
ncbi:MAG TPA: DUF2812 domain-containing protein [Epulopiscium sp.]|nr:DUF2812 domain-containing protein [Candidatus Epulonipiscium sp.]